MKLLHRFATNGALNLIGGPVDSAGTIEVCIDGVWATVCDSFWDDSDAKVMCRQLGYPVDTPGACKWHMLCDITVDLREFRMLLAWLKIKLLSV